jgi:hypothetical protein
MGRCLAQGSATNGRRAGRYRRPGTADPPAAPCSCSRPSTSCGRYYGGQRRRPAPAAGLRHPPSPPATRHPPSRVSLPGNGRMTGVRSPLRAVLNSRANRGAANDRDPAGPPAAPSSGRARPQRPEARRPRDKTEGQTSCGAAQGRQRAGHSPRTLQNAMLDRAPGMIEGHLPAIMKWALIKGA